MIIFNIIIIITIIIAKQLPRQSSGCMFACPLGTVSIRDSVALQFTIAYLRLLFV